MAGHRPDPPTSRAILQALITERRKALLDLGPKDDAGYAAIHAEINELITLLETLPE